MSGPPEGSYLIGAVQLRALFNAQNFPEKLRRGEIFAKRTKSWPADQSRGLGPETLSIMCEYLDGRGRFIAEVHYYQRRGGPSTEHDPKQLVLGNTHYVLDPGD
jgi:hypothetical protein